MFFRAAAWAASFVAVTCIAGAGRREGTPREAVDVASPRHARAAGEGFAVDLGPNLYAEVDAAGLSWVPRRAAWSARLSTRRYGCVGAPAPIERRSRGIARGADTPAQIEERAGRVALSEWYATRPQGIEQGWTLPESACAGGKSELDVEVTGLTPAPGADAQGVVLRDARGETRLHYSDLWARDADGTSLEAHMTVMGSAIALEVDTRRAKFPVVVDPVVWNSQKIQAADVATAGAAQFGASAAVSGSVAVLGAPAARVTLSGQGAVYVFGMSNGTWTQQQELVASDAATNGGFGGAVALSGTTLVIGNRATSGAGAVYVFAFSNGTWAFSQKLTAGDATSGDMFGFGGAGATPLAISGTTIFVGAAGANGGQGAVYVFDLVGASYAQQQKLVASDAASTTTTPGASFGTSVAASGNVLVAGAPFAAIGTTLFVGAAYVFTAPAGAWTQEAELVPPSGDVPSSPNAGGAVAVSGTTVYVGADAAPNGGGSQPGAVYAYMASGATFGAPVKLLATPATSQSFGQTLAVSGGRLIVGSPPDTTVYVVDATGGTFTQQLAVGPPDAVPNGFFAGVIAFDGTTLLATEDDFISGGNTVGEAYIGALTPPLVSGADGGSGESGATPPPDAGSPDTGATPPQDAGHDATTGAGSDAAAGMKADAEAGAIADAMGGAPHDVSSENADLFEGSSPVGSSPDASSHDAAKGDATTASADGAAGDGSAPATEGDASGTFLREPPSCACRMTRGSTTNGPFFATALFACAILARRRARASGRSKHNGRAAAIGLVLLSFLLRERSARADDEAQHKAAARALATEGFEAIRAEHWADAAARFSRAESLLHAPAHLLYLARAYSHLGKLVAAHETYEKLTRETLPDGAPPAARHAQEDGAKELDALEAHMPKLIVSVTPTPPGLAVEMDGAEMSSAMLGVAIPVDPGPHTLVAKADGFSRAERSVDAADGVRTTVSLSLDPLPGPAATAGRPAPAIAPASANPPASSSAAPPPLVEKDAAASSGGGLGALRVGGIVSLVAAAGAGGASAFFALQSADNRTQADHLCAVNTMCPNSEKGPVNSFDSNATLYGELAVASVITAGALAAFGVTALVLPQHATSSEPTASVWVGPASVGLRGTF
jgi:hypothetical protein